jgi:hypothetical protein
MRKFAMIAVVVMMVIVLPIRVSATGGDGERDKLINEPVNALKNIKQAAAKLKSHIRFPKFESTFHYSKSTSKKEKRNHHRSKKVVRSRSEFSLSMRLSTNEK